MIKLSGSLSVKSINGRNGAFSVGKLTTPVGEFTVKDTILDQYPEGKYDGEFLISKIFPYSYSMRGYAIFEVRCILDDIIISQADEGVQHQEAAQAIPDPLEEIPPEVGGSQKLADIPAQHPDPGISEPQSDKCAPAVDVDDLDRELFGDAYENVAARLDGIKLDPTVDRAKFRAQRDRLKALGYRFDSATQSWLAPAGD